METKEEKIKMRKTNTKLFPMYKALSNNYLFYYTIDFLFFTQIKQISAANVILKDSFHSFFNIVVQIPSNLIIEFLGRRNSIILGNILNCLYMLIIILSRNLGDLILAEFISSIAFSIKEIAQPSLLSESIPASRYKSSIYTKIRAKGISSYHKLNAISKIAAGFLFTINGYLPIICSLVILIIATMIAINFIEPVKKRKIRKKDVSIKEQFKDINDGFIFILKSERLKALILSSALIVALIDIASSYHISLLEDLKISSVIIGIIAALGSVVSSHSSKKQEEFHTKRRNRSLSTISFLLSSSCILAGIAGIATNKYEFCLIFIIFAYIIYNFCNGLHNLLIDKYLSNFANKKIDTKIYSVNNLFSNIVGTISGIFASFLIDKMATAYCMIIMGIVFTFLYVIMSIYMKTRVGLKPEEYDEEERKYEEK